ncbi:uncharacterized protein LOC116131039 [Pistacia vera]|uniref:uncharacterized protein LOC116131039 n=1 Tax=Pistacia vera TaxID=55513 RepID=UPI0012633D62|nr:uncharacterized protein LOC116131039 [Pistacia vera]
MLQWHVERYTHSDYDQIDVEILTAGGVVCPFLTATGAEAKEDYVTSFKALEDARDERIDRLIRDLKGVTHVMAVTGPLLHNVVDAVDDKAPIVRRSEEEEKKREKEVHMPQ